MSGSIARALLAVTAMVTLPHLAWSKPFTCAELGSFTEQIAEFRDQGVPLSVATKAVIDGTMTERDKQLFVPLVRSIYNAPSTSPAAWAVLAEKNCLTARLKR